MDYKDIIKDKRLAKIEQDREVAISNDVRNISETLKKPLDVIVENIDINKLSEAISSLTKVTGAKGAKGDVGKNGKDGIDGIDGYTPIKGIDYFDGIDGKDGIDGYNGHTPIKGIDYFDGKNGKDGKDGADGKDGKEGERGERGFPGQNGRNGLNAHEYYLPIAKHDVLGGIKIGTGLTIDEQGVVKTVGGAGTGIVETVVAGTGISVNSTDIANPIVTNTSPDQVVSITAGTNIDSITGTYPSFTINAASQGGSYTLPTASGTILGGVKVGTRLSIDGNGVLSADVQSGGGDVIAPATNNDNYIPQWNGANSKTLKNGLELTTVSPSAAATDSQIPSSKSVFDYGELKATQFPGICAKCPIGAADISIDYDTRVLTITPPLGTFDFFTDGNGVINKHTKVGAVVFPAFTNTLGNWNFYFDNNGDPTVTQNNALDYNSIAMVYRLFWSPSLSGADRTAVEVLETHQNTVSGVDHTWKHKYGAIWVSGGNCVSNALASGTPNADGRNAVISLTTLTNLDDNLPYTVENSTGGSYWQQDMGNISAAALNATNSGLFKIRSQSAGGEISYLPISRFPFAFNVSNTPEYITSTGARTSVTAGNYFVYFVYALQDPRTGQAVKSVSSTSQYNTQTLAEAVSWSDIQAAYPTLNDGEIRPLYKLLYQYQSGYDVGTKKAVLRQVQDLRVARVTSTTAVGSVLATSVINTPSGNIVATNLQDAVNELDTEKVTANVAITGATKTKITYDAKGLVTSGVDATTADIADSTNKRYVTDAQLVVIGNTSGTNTGDQTTVTGSAGSVKSNTTTGVMQVTGPTTGTTRVMTIPDANATLLYSGGALGTPASGTVTNLTGTASININGTVGATTATTGKFTTVETTGNIELGHASDTTIARVSAGVVSIEGSNIIKASNKLSDLSATTSAELAGVISDETGTGVLVFGTAPTLSTPLILGGSGVAATPAAGLGTIFGVGTNTVRPHWINSSGTDETIITTGSSELITNSMLSTTSGELGGVWLAWTPTLTGITKGAGGTLVSKYTRIGKTVNFTLAFTFGSGSSVTGDFHFTLPATNASQNVVLNASIGDSGTNTFLAQGVLSSGECYVRVVKSDATYATSGTAISATIPMTWTTNDTLQVSGTYETT